MKRRKNKNSLLQLRDDIYVNINNIDTIVRTDVDPKTNNTLGDPIYIIYLKNSKYSWVSVSISEFNNLIKPYI